MTVAELFDLKDSASTCDELRALVGPLYQAILDWPRPVETVHRFIEEIKAFLQSDIIDQKAIISIRETIYVDKHLWELESLESVSKMLSLKSSGNLETLLQKWLFVK